MQLALLWVDNSILILYVYLHANELIVIVSGLWYNVFKHCEFEVPSSVGFMSVFCFCQKTCAARLPRTISWLLTSLEILMCSIRVSRRRLLKEPTMTSTQNQQIGWWGECWAARKTLLYCNCTGRASWGRGFSDCCGMPFNKGHSHTEIVNLRDFLRSPHVREERGEISLDDWLRTFHATSMKKKLKDADIEPGEVWFCERHQTRLKWDESYRFQELGSIYQQHVASSCFRVGA